MGSMSRRKGKVGEREAANALKAVYPNVQRSLLAQARDGEEAHDLEGTPWGIEVKRMRRCNILAAMKQCRAACVKSGLPPLVITRDDDGPMLVTLEMDAFVKLVEMTQGKEFKITPAPSAAELEKTLAEGSDGPG